MEHRIQELIQENSQEAVITIGLDHRIRTWSKGAERMYGWDVAEAVGAKVYELTRPDVLPEAFEALLLRLQVEGRSTETNQRRRKDGSILISESTYVVVRDDHGAPLCILCIARDVTELTASRPLEFERARLDGLDARINEAEFVLRRDGTIVHANDRVVRMYGYSLEELRTLSAWGMRAKSWDEDAEAAMDRAWEEGIRFESLHRRKDGSEFPVEISGRTFELGGETYLHALVRDLTEAKRAEQELRESERRLALVLEGSSDGFWDCDLEGGKVWYSPSWARMLGFGLEEIEPTLAGWQSLIHKNDVARVNDAVREYLVGKAPAYECEHRLRRKDGTWAWVLGRGKVVERAADGRPTRVAGSNTDITARREAEEALQATNKGNERLVQDLLRTFQDGMPFAGFLGACIHCMKISDGLGDRKPPGKPGDDSEAMLTRGGCPECTARHTQGAGDPPP